MSDLATLNKEDYSMGDFNCTSPRKRKNMFNSATVISLLSFCFIATQAQASHPTIDGAMPDTVTADPYQFYQVSFFGDHLLPEAGSDMKINQRDFQMSFRNVGQEMPFWKTSSFDHQAPADPGATAQVTSLGGNGFTVAFPVWLTKTPGDILVNVCIRTVGCTNNFKIKVVAASTVGALAVQTSDAIDIAVPVAGTGADLSHLNIPIIGLTGYNPTIKINNGREIEGSGYPDRNAALFMLSNKEIPTPDLYRAVVTDMISGASDPILVRAFGAPVFLGSPPKISQELTDQGFPGDHTIELNFKNFTGPSQLVVVDNKMVSHTVAVKTEPVGAKAKLTIPGSWFKIGSSQLKITPSNMGGTGAPIIVETSFTRFILHHPPGPVIPPH